MKKGGVLLLCAAALAASCGGSNSAPVPTAVRQVKRPAVPKPGPTPAELTAGMVEAVTLGKSTVPVALKFEIASQPTVGKPFEVALAIMPQIAAGPAVLDVTDSDNLRLPSGSSPIEIPAVDPAQVYRQTLQVTPTAEGVQLLGLSISLKHDEITETRMFSVPLIVVAPGMDAASNDTH